MAGVKIIKANRGHVMKGYVYYTYSTGATLWAIGSHEELTSNMIKII